MNELWFWSAILNFAFVLPMVWFSIQLTEGAGFGSWPALLRYLQRAMLCVMSVALICCALYAIRTRWWAGPIFFFQVMFYVNFVISVARHITSPAIPPGARWGRKVVTELKVQ